MIEAMLFGIYKRNKMQHIMNKQERKPQKPCDKCWLKYSSYCVDCKYKSLGLGLIKEN